MKAVIDTNLLIRYQTKNDKEKVEAVEWLLDRAGKGEIELFIPPIVIAEMVWVLESYYSLPIREVADRVEAVLNTPEFHVKDKDILVNALTAYRDHGVDFIDGYIYAFAKSQGIDTVYTFDRKHFKRLPIRVIEAKVNGKEP